MNKTNHLSRFLKLIFLIFLLSSCNKNKPLFEQVSSSFSGIHFRNDIIENDTVNQLDIENVYNGGGVGIGDFNNDGLPDIFFTGNVAASRLYMNNGDLRFADVTEQSGINTKGRWCRGVAVTDINYDGFKDIYVSVTLRKKPEERINLLYINQGPDPEGIPVFLEKAAEYGLNDNSHTTQAVFLDYDKDGDPDVYIAVNEINERYSPYMFRPVMRNGKNPSTGKLYRNDWNDSLDHPLFKEVSEEAGIMTEGYSHSATVTDINNDGWPDIYVGNDFFTNDLLWINNHDGTFTDHLKDCFKHTSFNTMGNDFADINNDGLIDAVTLDMNPEDNYRKKMMLPPASYQVYQMTERFNYSYQYVRNIIQLNHGLISGENSADYPLFSDISYLAGISSTDWSWTPLLADFDNDGYRDLIICNGYPKDITDHDFATFRSKAYKVAAKNEILSQVPVVKLHNYAFRNNGDLTFSDVSENWGFSQPAFSNGAVPADLDCDGDLDIVINNINDEASVYRNTSRERNPSNTSFIRLKLEGDTLNREGTGSLVRIYYDKNKQQIWENNPFRGYLSTTETTGHFGLGDIKLVDSLIVEWPDGSSQKACSVKADQLISLSIDSADLSLVRVPGSNQSGPLFRDISNSAGIDYVAAERDFIDFNIQKLLPHKFSEAGPYLAAGDIDCNGLTDFIAGGSAGYSSAMFLQQADGRFDSVLLLKKNIEHKTHDDAGILLFDADLDNDPDLYIASGGYENESYSPAYQDHFYINNGKGNYTEAEDAIPANHTSKSCVISADIDHDGDADLFVGGRVDPWHYPKAVSSVILRNDSGKGRIKFTDVTAEIAPGLINIGMVNDAVFSDFDNDGWTDLVIAGEWMPVTFLKNNNGSFQDLTPESGTESKTGWWKSIAAADLDNDGDQDYIAGNLGTNSYYKASKEHPVSVYASDFDNNGSYDAFLSHYLPASQADRTMKEYPVNGRDDAVKQMISLRSKFQNYKLFAMATIDELFTTEQLGRSLILRANCFESSVCINEGHGRFKLIPLPVEAQLAPVNSIITGDFDNDGIPDAAISGNDWGTEVLTGRYDALNGLILKGKGNCEFSGMSVRESGFYIPGNGRSLVKLADSAGNIMITAAQNRGKLKIFKIQNNTKP